MEQVKFYAVWRDKGGNPPNKRHASHEDAVKEAMRLAATNGGRFYILEVTSYVEALPPPVQYVPLKRE